MFSFIKMLPFMNMYEQFSFASAESVQTGPNAEAWCLCHGDLP